MKKQKKPIILVLIVAMLFGAVAFMNRDTSNDGKPDAQQPVPPPEENSKSVAADAKAQLGGGVTKKTMQPAKKQMMGPPMMTPSILRVHTAGSNKPKPLDTNTSTQWYTKQTGKS